MRAVDIIRKKRDGETLTAAELAFLIGGHLRGDIPDYQMSSFLMAVYQKGMTDEETVALTDAMLKSGEGLDLSGIQGIKIDKHSTGGVGDKTSIILAPLMAAMGLKVPMVAGRGLGHTGGTLDKLASIPGLRTDISAAELRENLLTVGFSIMGQTAEMAPADRRLYPLRDATATVESIPLIAASIMSKKLGEGIDALVLDVKTGSGAFMKSHEDARRLARLMVRIGNSMGVKTVALITDMDTPLGKAVGNSLEIKECISALKGRFAPDIHELTVELSAWMVHLADAVSEETSPKKMSAAILKRYKDEIWDYIEHGDAFRKFAEFIDAQHGNPEAAFELALLPRAEHIKPVLCPQDGFLSRLDALAVGQASVLLGAGRNRMDDEVDLAAGLILSKKPGEPVSAGEPLATLHTNNPESLAEAEEVFLSGVGFAARELAPRRLVREVLFE